MVERELLRADQRTGPVVGASRGRVLSALQEAGEPRSVAELAARVGLHANTARFHLDALVAAGLVSRTTEDRERPGRPRALYTARPGVARAGRRSYRLLAEILTSFVAGETPRPAATAVRAGRAWGRYLADRPPPFRPFDAEVATGQLVATLDEIGFAPEAVTTAGQRRVLLHHCPFREAAEEHPEVVCSIHLGLMRGLLSGAEAPLEAERVDPFVEPGLCVAHLTGKHVGDRNPAGDEEPGPAS